MIMGKRKAVFAAWCIMLLLAALLTFVLVLSKGAFRVMEIIFAAYGFISCGDDLIKFLSGERSNAR